MSDSSKIIQHHTGLALELDRWDYTREHLVYQIRKSKYHTWRCFKKPNDSVVDTFVHKVLLYDEYGNPADLDAFPRFVKSGLECVMHHELGEDVESIGLKSPPSDCYDSDREIDEEEGVIEPIKQWKLDSCPTISEHDRQVCIKYLDGLLTFLTSLREYIDNTLHQYIRVMYIDKFLTKLTSARETARSATLQ
jgi:hypothetical protein